MKFLVIDNGIEHWVSDREAAADYARFKADFGSDDYTLIAYEGQDLFSEVSLDLQLEVLSRLESITDVATVRSIPSVYRDQFGAEDPEALRQEVTTTPFYEHVIISPDHQIGGMVVNSQSTFSTQERKRYLRELHRATAPLRAHGWTTRMVGPAVLNVALDKASERESRRLLPWAVVFSTMVLGFRLRSLRKVLLILCISGVTLGVTLGLMGWLGFSMNMVTIALPPILWVLSMAYSVHFLRYYERAICDGRQHVPALRWTVSQCLRPSLLSAMTTALGFLALLTATMIPVRELGIATAAGIAVAFLSTFALAPFLIGLLRIDQCAVAVAGELERGQGLSHMAFRYPKAVLLAGGMLAFLSILFASRISVESNPLTFLDAHTAVVEDSDFVARHFSGLYTLEKVLNLPGSWLAQENWTAIEKQTQALSRHEGIARVISPLDYLKKLNQWEQGGGPEAYRLPDSTEAATRMVADLPIEEQKILALLVKADGKSVRLSALVRVMDGEKLLGILRDSEAALADAPAGFTGYHTGIVLQLVQAQIALIRTQVKSLALALLVVFTCILVGLRSFRLLFLSILPNLVPILVLFGFMGLVSLPLDPATVMVAAMALGIAVDDTMHLLCTWQERTREICDAVRAMEEAVRLNGPAMIATTATACAGFLALSFSAFGPIRYFGLLSGGTMAVALLADLWLLPALVTQCSTKKGKPS